jgi:hypothetical protein
MSPQLSGRIGGLRTHARHDSVKHLAPARRAFLARFEKLVDPDGVLPAAERHKRAQRERRAFMLELAAKSAEARRARKAS